MKPRDPNEPRPRFRWGKAVISSVVVGAGSAATAAGTAAYTIGNPVKIVVVAGIAFVGGAATNFSGEVVKHRADDPSPVFDGPTTLLFDLTGYIVCLLLFYVPALSLDHAVHPDAPMPGLFGFAALFLSAFLMPVLRGLLINLGLVRDSRDREFEAP